MHKASWGMHRCIVRIAQQTDHCVQENTRHFHKLAATAAKAVPTRLWCGSCVASYYLHSRPPTHLSFPLGEHVDFGLREHCSFLFDLRLGESSMSSPRIRDVGGGGDKKREVIIKELAHHQEF